jgi:peptide/nickel transport system substrate-binding protein
VVDGEPAKFEVLNETTVRYTWSKPNPHFLPRLAGASPLFIFRPAHYLKAVPQDLLGQGARRGSQRHGEAALVRGA